MNLREVVLIARQQIHFAELRQCLCDGEAGVAGEDVAPIANAIDPLARVAGGDEKTHLSIITWSVFIRELHGEFEVGERLALAERELELYRCRQDRFDRLRSRANAQPVRARRLIEEDEGVGVRIDDLGIFVVIPFAVVVLVEPDEDAIDELRIGHAVAVGIADDVSADQVFRLGDLRLNQIAQVGIGLERRKGRRQPGKHDRHRLLRENRTFRQYRTLFNVLSEIHAFVGNRNQVKYVGTRDLDWSKGGRGNYWSDNPAFDLNGDGIADTAYRPNDLVDRVLWTAPAAKVLDQQSRRCRCCAGRRRSFPRSIPVASSIRIP